MKILVFTPVWKRPEITQAFCLGLSRLRNSFDVSALCVLSPEDPTDNSKLMDEHDIEYVLYPNVLGAKKNFGLNELLKKDFDYMMELNSDDIVKDELIHIYLDLMSKGVPFIGVGNFAFYEATTGKAKHKKTCSTLFGIGRCYSKECLEEVSRVVNVEVKETFTTSTNHFKKGSKRAIHPSLITDQVDVLTEEYHKLWDDDADKGMDNHSERVFSSLGVSPHVVTTDAPLAFDIKSDVNIWPYHKMSGEPYSKERLFKGLSKEEKQYLDALHSDN